MRSSPTAATEIEKVNKFYETRKSSDLDSIRRVG